MSGTVTNSAAASGSTATGTTSSGTSTSSSSTDPLASLTGNFQTFLQLLMTQLQNQDPTSPMDSNAFTTELVQFAGVEQAINTNTNLTSLISLTQGSSVLQSTQMIGKTVHATSTELSLQNSTASVQYTAQQAGTASVSVTDSGGNPIYSTQVSASSGANSWTWNGQTNGGGTAPDGAYNVKVVETTSGGSTTQLTTSITGTVTGVQSSGSTVNIELGGLAVPIGSVTSVQ